MVFKPKNVNPWFLEKNKDGNEVLYDIYARLVRERVIFLNNDINDESAGIIVAQMYLLDIENSEEPIELWINSVGGETDGFFAIYDTMHMIKAPVHTVCVGSAMSAAAILLASGDPGHRFALPNSHIMIHQVQVPSHIGGSGTDVEIEAKEVKKIKDSLNEILARHTGNTKRKIKDNTENDKYMDAETAKEFGIIDNILERSKDKPLPELLTRQPAKRKKGGESSSNG
jgi:ATP-dependent Clp protease protease subunit